MCPSKQEQEKVQLFRLLSVIVALLCVIRKQLRTITPLSGIRKGLLLTSVRQLNSSRSNFRLISLSPQLAGWLSGAHEWRRMVKGVRNDLLNWIKWWRILTFFSNLLYSVQHNWQQQLAKNSVEPQIFVCVYDFKFVRVTFQSNECPLSGMYVVGKFSTKLDEFHVLCLVDNVFWGVKSCQDIRKVA